MIKVNEPIESTSMRLNKALSIRGLTQKDICDRTGLSSACVSQYSTGKAKPKADKIFLMAKALNVDETWLLGYDVPMEKSKGNFSNVNTDAIVDYIIDDDMRIMIETVSKMPDDKRLLVYQLVKSMV